MFFHSTSIRHVGIPIMHFSTKERTQALSYSVDPARSEMKIRFAYFNFTSSNKLFMQFGVAQENDVQNLFVIFCKS